MRRKAGDISVQAYAAYILFCIALLHYGCSPSELPPLEYKKWIENPSNGLKLIEETEDFRYTLQYQPIPYMILSAKDGILPIDSTYQKLKNEYQGLQYYTLKIETIKGKQNPLRYKLSSTTEYNDRVFYSSTALKEDLVMRQSELDLPCKLYHFERTYDLLPNITYVFAFDELKPRDKESRTLQFTDKLFSKETIDFTFSSASLTSLPKLKIR